MTKTDLQEFINYFRENTQEHTREFFDYKTHTNDVKLVCEYNTLIDILERYPVEENKVVETPSLTDQLFEIYERFKASGFDPAQAFDLTRSYYENWLNT